MIDTPSLPLRVLTSSATLDRQIDQLVYELYELTPGALRPPEIASQVEDEARQSRFWQEIYDDQGKLIEIHEKYPVDRGHQKV